MTQSAATITLLVLAFVHVLPARPSTTWRGGIVFDSDRTDSPEHRIPDVYLIRPDGTGERQLTFSRPGEFSRTPSLSPDGERIVFQGRREPGGDGLFVLTCADGHLTRVASVRGAGPAWSPDGRKIAFAHEGALFLIDADGANLRKLVGLPDRSSGPSWSPNGKQIAFTAMGEVNWEIFAVELDSGRVRQLTRASEASTTSQAPDWSSDGKKIAFDRVRDGNFDIYVVNADGTGLTRLTGDPGIDARPAWSPGGRSLVFHSTRDRPATAPVDDLGDLELYTMGADGSGVRRLTTNRYFDGHPDW